MKTLLEIGMAFAGTGTGILVTYLFGLAYGMPLRLSDMCSYDNLPFIAVAIVSCIATTMFRELFGKLFGGPFTKTVDLNRWFAITLWCLFLVVLINLYILPFAGTSFWAISLAAGCILPLILYNDLEKHPGNKRQFALAGIGVSVLMLLATYAVAWVQIQL